MQRKLHVLQRRHPRKKIEVLKHEPDAAIAHLGQGIFGQFGNVLPGEKISAGVAPVQTPQDVHERSFSAAGGTANRDHLPLVDDQAHIVQRVHGLPAEDVRLDQVLRADHQCFPLPGMAKPVGILRGLADQGLLASPL